MIGGPTGAGKDTIVAAFNRALFGHDGAHLNFSMASREGHSMNALINGPPTGNHNDKVLPAVVRALDQGRGTGILFFNESNDLGAQEFAAFKVLLEQGMIVPQGEDPRPRHIYFPIVISGQFGEHIFENKTAQEARAEIATYDRQKIDALFQSGNNGDRSVGYIEQAVLDRAHKNGGVYYLAPVPVASYVDVLGTMVKRIKDDLWTQSRTTLKINRGLLDFIAKLATQTGAGTRVLSSYLDDLTRGAIVDAKFKGLSYENRTIRIRINLEKEDKSFGKVIVKDDNSGHLVELDPSSLLRGQNKHIHCETIFNIL